MKKLLILIAAMFMMVGCVHKDEKSYTFMVTRDQELYALYNQDAKRLTDYRYKDYEEVVGVGYIVTDVDDKKGFISLEGEEIVVPGMYETLEVVDKMLYATKKIEIQNEKKETPKKNDPFVYGNLYVLNSKGEVLYSADKETGIMKSGLPVIKKNQQYIVLFGEGQELYNGQNEIKYVYQNAGECYIYGLENSEELYVPAKEEREELKLTIDQKGEFKILLQNDKGVLLYDQILKNMIYVDYETQKIDQHLIELTSAEFDEAGNIILKGPQKSYMYEIGKSPILLTSYYMNSLTYASRSTVIYGPHVLYKDGKISGELENCQFYPEGKLIFSEMFPVYVRDTGYQYYNFDSKMIIDKVYLAAEPFDANSRAIVKEKEDGYSLIDEKGNVLTKDYYYQIKYIGSSYYAVYNESGMFGIIDKEGNEIFDISYTTLPEQSIIVYDESIYMILGKNGRTYVYDIDDEMNVIFSNENSVIFDEKGYFIVGNQYYTFDGELID